MMKERIQKIIQFILVGKRRYVVAVVALCVIGGATYAWTRGNGMYDHYTVARGTIVEEVSIIGKVKAAQDVTLSFESAGTVAEVVTPVGTKVHKGDVLARLKAGELAAQRDSAYAKLSELQNGTRPEELAQSTKKTSNAQTALADAQTGLINNILDAYARTESAIRSMDEVLYNGGTHSTSLAFNSNDPDLALTITSKRIQLEQSIKSLSNENKTSLTIASSSALHSKILAEQNFIATARAYLISLNQALYRYPNDAVIQKVTVASARTDLSTARTSVETAANNLTSAYTKWQSATGDLSVAQEDLILKQTGTRGEQIAAQEAVVREYTAKLDTATLRAPFDGVVTRMEARTGETVSANTSIAALSSGSNFEIEAYVPEIEIGKISLGNESTVTLDAYPNVLFHATVSSLDLTDTVVSGVPTYKSRLTLKENDPRIRSGMTANLDIRSAPTPNLLVVPARALTMDAGKRVVRIPTKRSGDNFSFVPVSIGRYGADGMVEITSGLSEGDRVLVPTVKTP